MGYENPDRAILESLISIRRAGADFIVTYFAKETAKLLGMILTAAHPLKECIRAPTNSQTELFSCRIRQDHD